MRFTLLHAHPLHDSYSSALRDRVAASLQAAGNEVTVLNLGVGSNETGSSGAASRDAASRDAVSRDAASRDASSSDISGITGAVAGNEGLVLVYPTWWGGLPAVLLDWVQRGLGPWIDGGADPATSPLRTVHVLAAVTSHGSSRLINRLQGEPGRQLLARTVPRLCAPRTRLRWIALYKIDRCDQAARDRFLSRAGSETARLGRSG